MKFKNNISLVTRKIGDYVSFSSQRPRGLDYLSTDYPRVSKASQLSHTCLLLLHLPAETFSGLRQRLPFWQSPRGYLA